MSARSLAQRCKTGSARSTVLSPRRKAARFVFHPGSIDCRFRDQQRVIGGRIGSVQGSRMDRVARGTRGGREQKRNRQNENEGRSADLAAGRSASAIARSLTNCGGDVAGKG